MIGIMFAVAQLVFSGEIGQARGVGEEPVPWTDCAWVVSGRADAVHFPGGWRVREGRLEREAILRYKLTDIRTPHL